MNTAQVETLVGSGAWVEGDGHHSAKVGVIEPRNVRQQLAELRTRPRNAGFRTRETGTGSNVLLRVWKSG